MPNGNQLKILRDSVQKWNVWRAEVPSVVPDLSGASLQKAVLCGANLRGCDMFRAKLGGADLVGAEFQEARLRNADFSAAILSRVNFADADLRRAYMSGAQLQGANLRRADLRDAKLRGASLRGANLSDAYLNGADLSGADLSEAILVRTHLKNATVCDCRIYGAATWDLRLDGTTQANLCITPAGAAEIMVDNLEVAQFLYLMMQNGKIQHIIDATTSRVVLILGRFSDEDRKSVLDALREALGKNPYNYVPVLFDFDPSMGRNIVETIRLLAGMARFIVADLTAPAMVRVELALIVPDLPSLPIQPLLHADATEFVELDDHLRRYPWVLPPFRYSDVAELIAALSEHVVGPAEAKAAELRRTAHSTV
jgi:Pentapeptide repeats (8 copies)